MSYEDLVDLIVEEDSEGDNESSILTSRKRLRSQANH